MKIKKCNRCKEFKPINEFSKCTKSKDGLEYNCRLCNKLNCLKYRHSKNGVITTTYNNQLRYSKIRSHPLPTYSKEELREWIFSQDLFHTLYDIWVESGYDAWVKPSVDRIDDYKSYTLDNIQLCTWRENNDRAHSDKKNGINNKNSKAVLQYDLDGSFIKEHYSMMQAERDTYIPQANISSVCLYKGRSQAGGSIWKYKN